MKKPIYCKNKEGFQFVSLAALLHLALRSFNLYPQIGDTVNISKHTSRPTVCRLVASTETLHHPAVSPLSPGSPVRLQCHCGEGCVVWLRGIW